MGSQDAGAGPNVGEEAIVLLVRAALAYEANKRPLRREDVNRLALVDRRARNFQQLLAEANSRLSGQFGMKLVPLSTPPRASRTSTVAGRRSANAAAALKRHESSLGPAAGSGSNSYILISECERPAGVRFHPRPYRLGLLAIILALISLSHDGLEEDTLMAHLESFGIRSNDPVLRTGLAEFLGELKRQKYVAVDKRSDDTSVAIYLMGPRGQLEFPPERLADFVVDLQRLACGGGAARPLPHFKKSVLTAFRGSEPSEGFRP